jgi:hypothetical protein
MTKNVFEKYKDSLKIKNPEDIVILMKQLESKQSPPPEKINHKIMAGFLNILSVISAFVFGTGMIYLTLDNTIGRFRFLSSRFEWMGLQIKDFIFLFIAMMTLICFVNFVKPY